MIEYLTVKIHLISLRIDNMQSETLVLISWIFIWGFIIWMSLFVYSINKVDKDHNKKMKQLKIDGTKHKYIISYKYSETHDGDLMWTWHTEWFKYWEDLDIGEVCKAVTIKSWVYPVITNIYKAY